MKFLVPLIALLLPLSSFAESTSYNCTTFGDALDIELHGVDKIGKPSLFKYSLNKTDCKATGF